MIVLGAGVLVIGLVGGALLMLLPTSVDDGFDTFECGSPLSSEVDELQDRSNTAWERSDDLDYSLLALDLDDAVEDCESALSLRKNLAGFGAMGAGIGALFLVLGLLERRRSKKAAAQLASAP